MTQPTTQPTKKRLNSFLRDAAVSFLPAITDDQLLRLTRALSARYPDILVRRLTAFTALVQGIAVEAETAHAADNVTWLVIDREVRETLVTLADAGAEITSIDVRLPAQGSIDAS